MLEKTNNDLMCEHQKALGYTNKQLAKALDISLYTVIAWRRDPKSEGHRTTPANLVKLAGFLIMAEEADEAARAPHGEH
ncbi:MAG: hypothetical protein KAV87_41185 [Desulfobacteraceae bacterium]|nr:hypothetical protein [Desulfobacteraceae bacterium]